MNENPHRKINRLKDYDYAQNGVYFVTICTKEKRWILGEITSNVTGADAPGCPLVTLSAIGQCVDNTINHIDLIYNDISVLKYVVMPNHIHLVVLYIEPEGNESGRPRPPLQNLIGNLKSYTSKQAGEGIWQKSFHDHVIRNEAEYLNIWEYIDTNPLKWVDDEYYSIE